jgi:hypothetical protein
VAGKIIIIIIIIIIFVVQGFKLRAIDPSHQPVFVKVFFKIGSHELFAQAAEILLISAS